MSATVVNDEDYVEITNLVGHRVGYKLPNGQFRRLAPYASMRVKAEELHQAAYERGNLVIFQDFIRVGNPDLAMEFGVDPEETVEYNWTPQDVKNCLNNENLDVLLDALDFAPEGIKQQLVDYAVELEIPDERKRKAIDKAMGVDITAMITNKHAYDVEEDNQSDNVEKPHRRSAAKKTSGRRVKAE